MSDNYILRVQILEGKGFGDDVQALLCSAGFAGEAKQTQYSVNSNAHIWNSTLTWSIRKDELRKAQATGSSHCKISVLGKDGTQLGWVVISLRSAKLQSQYKSDSKGLWLQLNASNSSDPPQLKVAYSLFEERSLSVSEQPSSCGTASSRSLRRSSSSYQPACSLRPSKVSSSRSSAANDETISDIHAAHGELLQMEGLKPPRESVGDQGAADGQQQQDYQQQQNEEEPSQEQAAVDHATADEDGPAIRDKERRSLYDKKPQQGLNGQHESTHSAVDIEQVSLTAGGSSQPGVWSAQAAASDGLAAAEANLPTYAQRRQQMLEQQQQQMIGSASGESAAAKSHVVNASEQSLYTSGAAAAAAVQHVSANTLSQSSREQQQNPAIHPLTSSFNDKSGTRAAELGHPAAGSNNTEHSAVASGSAVAGASVAASEQSAPLGLADSLQPAARLVAPQTEAADVGHAFQDIGDPMRQFELTLDVRSFQAGRRLPLALASTYVQAFLPQELLGFLSTKCAAKLPPRITPLRTLPAVDIARGSEGALPNGCVSVSFAAGVVSLAGLLAQEPKVTLEVWHKEKLRSDLLLGVASVSLSALLQECWVDGYAPVYALMTKASAGSDHATSQQEEKVQVGLLRVIMSLEDQGPAGITAAAAASPSKARQHRQHNGSTPKLESMADTAPVTSEQYRQLLQPKAGGIQNADAVDAVQQGQQQQPRGPQQQQQTAQPLSHATGDTAGAAANDLGHLPEYLVTWELETWKKAEEVKFRAQLRELEQQRMAVLEAQWWKSEQAREAELAAMKADFTKLQQQTQAVLSTAQEREASVLSAEADLQRRQADLERQQASRMTEAEAAVRRLQVECEHQLSVERDRTAAVARQRDDAEARLMAAEARAAGLEVEFSEYRAAQRNTSEAQLQTALERATQAARLAQERATKALKAKRQYKQQVIQLARELAELHQQRQAEMLQELNRQQAKALAHEQGRLASAANAELSALRQQLQELKTAALPQGQPDAAADSNRPVHRARGKENRRHHQYGQDAKAVQMSDRQWQTQHWQQHHHQQDQHDISSNESDGEHHQLDHAKDPIRRTHAADHSQDHLLPSDCDSFSEEEVQPKKSMRHTQKPGLAGQMIPTGPQSQSQAEGVGLQSFTVAALNADAALAEVAALAAILNKPQRQKASGPAALGHQQELQQLEAVDADLKVSAVDAPAEAADRPSASPEFTADKSIMGNLQGTAAGSAAAGSPSASGSNPLSEVRRLLKEKVELLASGLYNRDDAVILQIDARVQQLAERQLQQ